MTRRNLAPRLGLLVAATALAGCGAGPSVSGSFDRTLTITAPVRLELTNASGDVSITGSADGQVHVQAKIRASGFGFAKPQDRINEIAAHPPIDQKGDTIRIGKDLAHMRNVSISYVIEVPHDTEITTAVVSGAQSVRGVRGPLKAESASGSIRAEHIERQAQFSTISGSIEAQDIGDDVHANSASGNVVLANIRGDVRVNNLSGFIRISHASGSIEAESASGRVEVQDASKDVKAHSASGKVAAQGNPGPSSYWDLKTVSGGVSIGVPSGANFHFSADAASGEIKTDIPIVIEEQSRRSLRAHLGTGGGRVEVHTISGDIRVGAS